MKKILIAGGLGFVGLNMIEQWAGKHKLCVLDIQALPGTFQGTAIEHHQMDLGDQKLLAKVIEDFQPEVIINLISVVSAERDMSIFDKLININFRLFLNLYEASRNLNSLELFVNFGSAEEYGAIEVPFREGDRENPSSPYALVKQFTTNTAMMLNMNYGFPICVVRPANLFGKYQPKNKILPYLIKRLKNNETVDTTPGKQKRDFIHVEDFIDYLEMVFINHQKARGQIVNIGSGSSISIFDLVHTIKEATASQSQLNFGAMDYRENEMMDFVCDLTKLQEITGRSKPLDFKGRIAQLIGELE